jgi:hypothetical protein
VTDIGAPALLSNAINFNPAVDFDGSNNLSGPAGFYAKEYFVVAQNNTEILNTNS